jgi:putative FmdB family regulatory protein
MPIYTYRCQNCGAQIERHQSFDDRPLSICPKCRKKTLRRVIGATGVIFKGAGFYATDSKSASGRKSSGANKKEESTPKEEPKPKEEAKPKAASSESSE